MVRSPFTNVGTAIIDMWYNYKGKNNGNLLKIFFILTCYHFIKIKYYIFSYSWRPDGPVGNEAGKCRKRVIKYLNGNGLDLGCGNWKITPRAIGIDKNLYGDQVNIQGDVGNLFWFQNNCMGFVFSSHVLEDMENHIEVLNEWRRVIKPGGYLILYLPHKNYYPNIGKHGANTDHKHEFLPDNIINTEKFLSNIL